MIIIIIYFISLYLINQSTNALSSNIENQYYDETVE